MTDGRTRPTDEASSGAEAAAEIARALSAGEVDLPGTDRYHERMAGIFSTAAAHSRPAAVVRPTCADDVATSLRIASERGATVTARGGGLSMLAARTDAIVLDLAAHLDVVVARPDVVTLGGGATVGSVNDALRPFGRVVPTGVSPLAGLGLVLRGGIGHIARSHGLTTDHIVEAEIVLATGEVRRVAADHSGEGGELFWAARGAGPMVGIVTEVTLAPVVLEAVTQRQIVLPLDAVSACLEIAPRLPRGISQSLALGPAGASHGPPVLLADAVAVGAEREAESLTSDWARTLEHALGSPSRLLDRVDRLPFVDLRGFDVPSLPSSPAAPAWPGRIHVLIKSYFLSASAGARAGEVVRRAMRSAPNDLCRIHFQHGGGAVGDVPSSQTAFANRDWHWHVVVSGAWAGGHARHEECEAWVHAVIDELSPWVTGVYSVDIHPDRPESSMEVEMAFHDNLPRLRRVADAADPARVLLSHQLLSASERMDG